MSELILRTRELTRRYGRTLALDRASLSVEKGQILGLVGRNGAGKTTLIRLISGQSRPTSGELALFGASSPSALDRARSRTGVMVETPAFYPYLTAEQNLEYYRIQRGIPGRSCVDEALELVRLTSGGGFLLLGYLSLAALPIWAGGLSLIMAIYFLIASANMAAICYVALVLALPPLLDTLGKHISPFFQLLHHLTLSYQLDLLLNVQIFDWALIGRCWLVGLGWTAAATALGLFCFSRRELP